jgi:lipoprotein-anchoring transpeptidase ErfK/SrfK
MTALRRMRPALGGRMRAVALALSVAAVVGPQAALSQDAPAETTPASSSPAPSTPAATTPLPGKPNLSVSWVARIVLPTMAWHHASTTSKQLGKVEARSPWGGTNRLLVLDTKTVDGVDWLQVRLPGRPNAREGWIVAADADVFPNGWRLDISRKARRMIVWHDGEVARRFRVVVGAAGTPTPTGLFAIADALKQPDGKAFVGSWVLPLTAHSNVLQHFDGGDGQVALHGRGGASLQDPLGSARSHGCIRLANADISWLAGRIAAGTPVHIG